MRRALVPTALVAMAFAVSIANVSQESYWRFWGSFFGGFSVVLTFGISLWVLNRRAPRSSSLGVRIVISVLTLFGLLVTNWLVMWGVPPFTLEGAWMYPLAIVLLATVAIVLWPKRLRPRGDDLWSRPPG